MNTLTVLLAQVAENWVTMIEDPGLNLCVDGVVFMVGKTKVPEDFSQVSPIFLITILPQSLYYRNLFQHSLLSFQKYSPKTVRRDVVLLLAYRWHMRRSSTFSG